MSETDGSKGSQLGDDLSSLTVEHYSGESRPDMLSPDQDYVGFYRVVTPRRVLFVSAVHRAEKSDGRIERLHINVNVADGRGEFKYLGQRSDHFNESEKRAIAERLKAEFKRDRKLLFPLHVPSARRDDEIEVVSSYDGKRV